MSIKRVFTNCAICGEKNNFKIIYSENLNLNILDKNFTARRFADKYNFRIVRCKNCGLLRSNPIISNEIIEKYYSESKFLYLDETENIKTTYGFYLKKLNNYDVKKERFLEIGCGNGFFLERAIELGYKNVLGIEPSKNAFNNANYLIKNNIRCEIFDYRKLSDNNFDVVCNFHVLDHVVNPGEFLSGCHKILAKNGLLLCIVHDESSYSAKLLKDKSPIIDASHIYLFNKKTLIAIHRKYKFKVLEILEIKNTYSLLYWIKMLPLSNKLKENTINVFRKLSLTSRKIGLKAGNIGIICRK